MFLCNKLIPFYTGPKLTSRMPPQLEVTLFVRGTWRIPLDGPLELVDDPIEQGFMTGDVFAEDDVERTGALLYASDFADFKLNNVIFDNQVYCSRGELEGQTLPCIEWEQCLCTWLVFIVFSATHFVVI